MGIVHRLRAYHYHDPVLLGRVWHLHPARSANGWVRHIAISAYLI